MLRSTAISHATRRGAGPAQTERRGWLPDLARLAPCDRDGQARIGRRHIYILPTGAGLLFGVVLLLMLLGSLNYQNNLALLFTFLAAAVGLVGMHHTWFNLLGLRVAVRPGAPVFAGQEARFDIAIGEERRRARRDLVVRAGRAASAALHLAPGCDGTLGLQVPTTRRGYLALDRLRVETRYPLGLFCAWCYPQTMAQVTVYPRPAAHGPAPPPVPAYRPSALGDLGVGADDFVGPRTYQPGDSPRRLDWKALARERGLVVKQFGGDRAAQVSLDWAHLPAVDAEARLRLLCRQVLDAADLELTFDLRLPDAVVPMGHGDVHKHLCLAALAAYGHG